MHDNICPSTAVRPAKQYHLLKRTTTTSSVLFPGSSFHALHFTRTNRFHSPVLRYKLKLSLVLNKERCIWIWINPFLNILFLILTSYNVYRGLIFLTSNNFIKNKFCIFDSSLMSNLSDDNFISQVNKYLSKKFSSKSALYDSLTFFT